MSPTKFWTATHDLSYTMAYEVLPKIELVDFKTISIERPVVEVTDAEVDEQVERLAESTRSFTTKDGAADVGDRVTDRLCRQDRRRAVRGR